MAGAYRASTSEPLCCECNPHLPLEGGDCGFPQFMLQYGDRLNVVSSDAIECDPIFGNSVKRLDGNLFTIFSRHLAL